MDDISFYVFAEIKVLNRISSKVTKLAVLCDMNTHTGYNLNSLIPTISVK